MASLSHSQSGIFLGGNSYSPVKYGELIAVRQSDSSTKRHFTLYQRPTPNGVKPGTVHKYSSAQAAQSTNICVQNTITFVTPVTTVRVEYAQDKNTDMFQIGRATDSEIDFSLGDGPTTVSRYACRIICQRSPPYTAHIYAAGFDSNKKIFLGLGAVKWESQRDGQMDGLTTNGVLVMQPLPGFTPGLWREISVCGSAFTTRESGESKTRGKRVGDKQELVDGSLIDLCGVTFLWRTTECPIGNLDALLKSLPSWRL